MDMRVRLLSAFVPLLVVLVLLIGGLASFGRTAADRLALQRERTDDLIESQELALLVFLEHDIAGHIADGEEPADSPRYRAARAEAEEMLAAEVGEPVTAIDDDPALAAEYAILSVLHDEVVATAATGDLAAAQALFERPELDESLERLIELAEQVSVATRGALAQTDTETTAASRTVLTLVAVGLLLGATVVFGLAWLLIQQVTRTLTALARDAEQFAAGERSGQLSSAGNIAQVQRLRDAFQQLIDSNAERQRRLQIARDELEQRVSREEQLRETVQALSVPVVPLASDTLLLPLVGYLDDRRAGELTRSLLEAIQLRRAKLVVLDITGLASLDESTAERLRQATEAARLLGCRVTLVGVRADQALTLAGINLGGAGVEIARDIPAVLSTRNGV